MLHNLLAIGCVLAPALALPSNHHAFLHHAHKSGVSGTGAPIVTGPSGAPYGMKNATAGALSTGRFHASYEHGPHQAGSTIDVQNASPSAAPGSASPDSAQAAADNNCGPATVTVTSRPTVTVTVGNGATAAAPSLANMAVPGPSNPELPQMVSTSAVAATQAAATPAPPKKQPAPVQPQPQNTPETKPTQALVQPQAPAAAAAPTSQAAAAPPSNNAGSPAPGLKTKRGIIASGSIEDNLGSAFDAYPKVSWLGNFYSGPPTKKISKLYFVPQNYGKSSDNNGDWTKNAKEAVSKNEKYMLSFGEPGTRGPDQMSPSEAAQLWMEKMEPYTKQGVTIGAPGTLQNPPDFDWLNQFLAACTQCTIGFIAMHWINQVGDIGSAQFKNSVAHFKDTLNQATAMAKGKPVWLDNFQAQDSSEIQKAFLQEVVPWLEAQENIQAYAYVPMDVQAPGISTGFLDGSGSLNDLGKFYASL